MKAYICGQMTGMELYNFPAFTAAAAAWRAAGYEVLNPAESFDGRTDLPRATYIRHDIPMVLAADCLAALPGWQKGSFATHEVAIARELGLPVYDARYPEDPRPYQETIAEEAQRLVSGERNSTYGDAFSDFSRVGKLWGALLGIDVGPDQVALCMAALKLSREAFGPKRDNRVDGIGYLMCLEHVRQRQAELSDSSS